MELKNYSRKEVSELMNAVDLCLLTSITEGSPQFTKEAIACNCPVVCVDVGDIKEQLNSIQGCYITTHNPEEIAEKINNIFNSNRRLNNDNNIKRYDNNIITEQIIHIYNKVKKRK